MINKYLTLILGTLDCLQSFLLLLKVLLLKKYAAKLTGALSEETSYALRKEFTDSTSNHIY